MALQQGHTLIFPMRLLQCLYSKKGAASFTGGILSTKKIRNELGWAPKYNISDGFNRTIERILQEMQFIQ